MYVTGLFKLSFYHLNPRWNWHILNLYLLNPCLDGHIFNFWIHIGNDIFWAYAFLIRVWIDIFFTCWIYNWTDIFWAFILWIHRMTHFEFWIFIWIGIFLHVESIFVLNFFELISFESIVGLIMYSKWFCLYRLNPCLDWYILSVYLLNTCFDWLIFVFYSTF